MAAEILNAAFAAVNHSQLDWPIIDYVTSLWADATDADDQPVESFIRPLLESESLPQDDVDSICASLQSLWDAQTGGARSTGPAKLDKVLDMRRQEHLSKKQTVTQVVDIASVVKARDTQVNLKALEKAEAKIRAKMEKRDRRGAYEGSKLMDANKGQKSYEELFLEVNPLQLASANKGKSKDIQLESIDLSFGSLRILSNATLTLAEGRRYGLIGRNGIGKSTLLRAMALREVAIPSHLSILFVQQEVIGDDTLAIESVLQADVHRTRLLAEEKELNAVLQSMEDVEAKDVAEGKEAEEGAAAKKARKAEDATARLGEVQQLLVEIDADSGPSRAAELLAGLGFSASDQDMPTRAFSGGWRMRLSLARALFCKPDLLLLDEPSNNLDLNALAWLEDYLQTWPGTLLVVSHDRAFLDAVATDIVYQHNERLDYYKGNFKQFYATKSERAKNQKREYEAQLQFRAHLQAFIDRWRYNANRAAQAQSKIKVLEKLPELEPPEEDDVVKFKFQEAEKISPPLLQLSEVSFGYTKDKPILKGVNIDVGLDSRLAIIGANGAGKSTLMKLLIGEISPTHGQQSRNGRLRIAYFAQHHIDSLDLTLNSVAFLQKMFPGKTDQEYRQHLGAFGITGMTGLQLIGTLSGGQKSRVSFATLSLQRPHILLLDEPTNHLDIEGLDALMDALKVWNGGVIVISHDSTFIHNVCTELWVCADQKCEKFYGDVSAYKDLIINNAKNKPTCSFFPFDFLCVPWHLSSDMPSLLKLFRKPSKNVAVPPAATEEPLLPSKPTSRRPVQGRINSSSPASEIPATWAEWESAYAAGHIDFNDPPPPPTSLSTSEARTLSGQFRAPVPLNEKRRQRAVDSLDVSNRSRKPSASGEATSSSDDLASRPAIKELAREAREFFKTGISSISLMDRSEQVFLAEEGLEVPSLPRDSTICSHTMLMASTGQDDANDGLVVLNLAKDWRFTENNFGVHGGGFYAAVPIMAQASFGDASSTSYPAGIFCILDSTARKSFSEEDLAHLAEMGRRAGAEIAQWEQEQQERKAVELAKKREAFLNRAVVELTLPPSKPSSESGQQDEVVAPPQAVPEPATPSPPPPAPDAFISTTVTPTFCKRRPDRKGIYASPVRVSHDIKAHLDLATQLVGESLDLDYAYLLAIDMPLFPSASAKPIRILSAHNAPFAPPFFDIDLHRMTLAFASNALLYADEGGDGEVEEGEFTTGIVVKVAGNEGTGYVLGGFSESRTRVLNKQDFLFFKTFAHDLEHATALVENAQANQS